MSLARKNAVIVLAAAFASAALVATPAAATPFDADAYSYGDDWNDDDNRDFESRFDATGAPRRACGGRQASPSGYSDGFSYSAQAPDDGFAPADEFSPNRAYD